MTRAAYILVWLCAIPIKWALGARCAAGLLRRQIRGRGRSK